MNDERDPFLADRIGRITPPQHRPEFWANLEDELAMSTKPRRPLSEHPWSSPRFLGVAAAVLVLVGIVVALVAANLDGDTMIDTGPATPSSTPATGDQSGSTRSSTATTDPGAGATSTVDTTAQEELDLTGAVELDASLDGSRRLFAVPDPATAGCEGQPTWQLHWVAGDGTAQLASTTVMSSVPIMARGDGGRVALLDRCEESTFLLLAIEEPPGTLSPLERLRPLGWEDTVVQEASWGTEPGVLVLRVTRSTAGDIESFRLEVDADTAEVLASEPLGPGGGPGTGSGTCSAQGLAAPAVSSGQPWSALAADIQQAALDCDYDRLAQLASPTISYSFGGSGDFAGHLRDAEAGGDDPMRKLALLLGAAPGERADPAQVVWPAFFACEATCGMDEAELRRLGYSDDDIAQFRDFGGYAGYRAGFAAGGSGSYTWTFFVAGD